MIEIMLSIAVFCISVSVSALLIVIAKSIWES